MASQKKINAASLWVDGEQYVGKQIRAYLQLINDRPSEAQILSGQRRCGAFTIDQQVDINRDRIRWFKFFNDALCNRLEYTTDRQNYGTPEHWRSYLQDFEKQGKNPEWTLRCDCDGLMLTQVEICALWGIRPELLYLIIVETKAGTLHAVAGMIDDDGSIWLGGDTNRRKVERHQDSTYIPIMWRRLDRLHEDWRYVSRAAVGEE